MTTEFRVGVSGFSYPSWKGVFYPKDIKSESFLSYYSERLNTVEINSSFYAPPREAVVKGWSGKTNEEFRFAFKAPQQVTHILKLGKDSYEYALRFSRTLDSLGNKRGPVLFQLPPFSKADLSTLEAFLTETSTIPDRIFEFRHESWYNDSTYGLLEKHKVALCAAEMEDKKPVFRVTAPLAYFRLRKDFYDEKAVDDWGRKIFEVASSAKNCFVFLRHDETGQNALLAQRLSKKLESLRQ